jgi:SAM-dependent methyltransferase
MGQKSALWASSEQWRRYGEIDPYFAALSTAQYRSDRMTEQVRAEFFESGRRSVKQLLTLLDEYVPTDRPLRRVMDFGCGPGRLALAFAQVAEDQVLGVDVSPGMLELTKRNAAQSELSNVQARHTDDLGQDDIDFDLVHSENVFQHIRPDLGEPLIRSLLRRVGPVGRVALNVATQPRTKVGRGYFLAVLRAPFIVRMWNVVRRRGWNYPLMEMHSYDIDTLVRAFAEEGFAATVVVPITGADLRGGYHAVWLLSRRQSSQRA